MVQFHHRIIQKNCNKQMKPQAMNIVKMISKPMNERMPFEGVELTKFVQKLSFFKRFFPFQSEKFITLCLSSFLMEFRPGENLYSKQSKPDLIYIIVDGCVKVQTKDSKAVRDVNAYDMLGHVEVVFNLRQRGERATTLSQTYCMVLKSDNFRSVWQQQVEIQKSYSYLKSNKYFQLLSEYDKKQLSLMMIKNSFKANQVLAPAGSLNQKLFFIIYGETYVLKTICIRGCEKEVIIESLQEMDSFGEYQAINRLNNEVTLQAASSGTYYTINIAEVLQRNHPLIKIVRENGLPYPDREELQFRFEVQIQVQKYKNEVKKKLKLYQ